MSRLIDLTGMRFGMLTVLERAPNRGQFTYWKCKCDCGNLCEVYAPHLRSGHTQSCGCYNREVTSELNTTHGQSDTNLYRLYYGMLCRCYNQKHQQYSSYGGRGIIVCSEWKDSFECFSNWAYSNGYKSGLSIDRINNDGNYEPNNCRWANRKVQNRNQRSNHLVTWNNETHCISEWEEILHMPYRLLNNRLNKCKWSIEKAFTTPWRPKYE